MTRVELSKAVNAAALSGAAVLRQGESEAEQRIRSLAAANGVVPTLAGPTHTVTRTASCSILPSRRWISRPAWAAMSISCVTTMIVFPSP